MRKGKENKNGRALNDIMEQSNFLYVTRNARFDRISANKHIDNRIDFGANLSAVLTRKTRKYNNACGSSTAYTFPANGRVLADCDENDCGCEHLTVEYHLFCIVVERHCTLSFDTLTKSSTRLRRVHRYGVRTH